jgi:predicted transposase YdaD
LEDWNVIESEFVKGWLAQGFEKGRQEGRQEGRVQALREALRELLEDRFGPLPDAVRQRIESASEPERLQAAVRRVSHLSSLADLMI